MKNYENIDDRDIDNNETNRFDDDLKDINSVQLSSKSPRNRLKRYSSEYELIIHSHTSRIIKIQKEIDLLGRKRLEFLEKGYMEDAEMLSGIIRESGDDLKKEQKLLKEFVEQLDKEKTNSKLWKYARYLGAVCGTISILCGLIFLGVTVANLHGSDQESGKAQIQMSAYLIGFGLTLTFGAPKFWSLLSLNKWFQTKSN